MNKVVINLSNITKTYQQAKQSITILQNLSLEVRAGELIGIIGASGSGKSTLLHIAGLLDNPTNGILEICDQSVSCATEAQLTTLRLQYLGFVYQNHHLLKDFSAIENIMLPQLILKKSKHVAKARAMEILKKFDLIAKAHNLPGELSGGEQQRIAIARALANDPVVLLADEPTGNLDPTTAVEVFEILLQNAKDNNIATIIVTHNHELAAKMDAIYLLQDGQLIKQ